MTGRSRVLGQLQWAAALRPFPGEVASGDRHAVIARGSSLLVGVIDALGHGVAAASTARTASRILEQHPDEPLPTLIRRCHDALRGDRGVVMSLASIDASRGTMAWAGVGNVSVVVLRAAADRGARLERLVQPAGIVGAHLPGLRAVAGTLSAGDLLVFATDGIRDWFGEDLPADDDDLQDFAERVVLDHATKADDALVLVVRYRGHA